MMRLISILLISLAIVLISAFSCTSGVTQQEYDRVSNEMRIAQNQLASLQGKLAEAESMQEALTKQNDATKSELETIQGKYEELSIEYEELSEKFNTRQSEYETMKNSNEELRAEYDELNEQFEELSEQYEIIMEGTAQIDEKDVEQAVFELVNEERIKNGLNAREWGENIYKWALANSRTMAANKQIEYTEYIGWQDVFWATGYGTAERIAKSALTIWKNHPHYERSFLNAGDHYAAVAVHKSGEIYYITYVADYYH